MNVRSNRRGFTLVEMTVVMAVLAIVLAMVTSFTAMVTGSRELSAARLEALQDIRVAETIIESFIEGNKITTIFKEYDKIVPSENALEAGEKKLTFDPRSKTLALDGGATLTLERVDSITFVNYGDNAEDINDGENAGNMYYCTIHYTVGDHEYDYTFCVYSYAGNGGA